MWIATWNVNGIRARLGRLTEWLAERKPDLVCLQELKIVEEKFPHAELEALGYQAALVGQPSWNGVAVLAKRRPEILSRELAGASEAGARFILCRALDLEIASVYIPNGKTLDHPDYPMKLAWLERLVAFIEARGGGPFVMGGDFNVCLTPMDSYGGARFEGHIFHTQAERSLVARLEALGLADAYRRKYPDAVGYTWWDYRAGCFHKNEGMRLDMLWMSAELAPRVEEVFVDREYRKKGKESGAVPSDHAPVLARLRD